ncbi:hypothetical protein K474DRAFT_1647191 [Panus rudis PR-1116 ss-1]|nr:hypothetical protein K474DRAFT_1647191 [Panus rudis PR-1116 ss-1]
MTVLRRSPLSLRRARGSRLIHHSASNAGKLTLGIRREDPTRIWERRCPLTPDAVQELIEEEDVQVLVQDCARRVFPTEQFTKAGANVHPTLSPAHITLGIKETPLNEVLVDPLPAPNTQSFGRVLVPRTHLMFSHTTKGQLYNMELLSKFLSSDSNPLPPRLIDYELLTGEDGKRTVGFGWFAGVSGALESLSALAHSLLELGIASPFLYTPRPHTHPSLPSIHRALRDLVGSRIASEGTPKSLGPIVIGVTGSGKVSDGVLDLLQHLPIVKVRVEDLPALVTNPDADLHKIYVVHALPQDYFVRKDGQAYDRTHYYAHPDMYASEFHTKVAPYLTLFINGAGWAQSFPRLMTNEHLTTALERAQQVGPGRFTCIGDISCDLEGGLEFLTKATTLSSPFAKVRPPTLPAHLPSITMMSVDILPTALPLESSQHFSNVLLPYLKTLIRLYRSEHSGAHVNDKDKSRSSSLKDSVEEERRAAALERATVASGGRLKQKHEWLQGPLEIWRKSLTKSPVASGDAPSSVGKNSPLMLEKKKRVLVLGSGMVAGPCIDEICSWPDTELVVASNLLHEAERLTSAYPSATPIGIDVNNLERVSSLIQEADVVISLLPVPFHPRIAELCIKHRKHMVTASYISPAMRSLHERARSSSVLLLNEIGLDPGIDHCSAISLLTSLRKQNKKIKSFTSFCGGLPAPECAEGVPLRYKFSWSPRGVLSAALNGARFKLWNQVQEIEGKNLLKEYFPNLPISDVLKLEGIANRDSLPYGDTYALEPLRDVRTLFRGTLRYEGFSSLMHQFKTIGLLESDKPIQPESWTSFVQHALQTQLASGSPFILKDEASIKSALSELLQGNREEETRNLLEALQWFGILPPALQGAFDVRGLAESTNNLPDLPKAPTAPIDIFTSLLSHKLRYLPNERDLVILSHEIVASSSSPSLSSPSHANEIETVHTSSLIAYGTPQVSAMATTVGLPVALATRIVLDGKVGERGVHGPGVDRVIWQGVLEGLDKRGVVVKESEKAVRRGTKGGPVERALSSARFGQPVLGGATDVTEIKGSEVGVYWL